MTLPDRLQPGKPPLRISELANLCGTSREYIRKLLKAGVLASTMLPRTSTKSGHREHRIPVGAAARFWADLTRESANSANSANN